MKPFIDWLREKIEQRGWTQADLAHAAKLSRTAVSNILTERRKPGPSNTTVTRISPVLRPTNSAVTVIV